MRKRREKVTSQISHLLSESDWHHIEAFKMRAAALNATKFVAGGSGRIQGQLHFDRTKGVSYSAELPQKEELESHYMAFRFFYLKKEPANFLRVLSIVGRHSEDERVRAKLSSIKTRWNGILMGGIAQLTVAGKPVTAADIINIWFNARLFHSDSEKEERLDEVTSAVGEEFAHFLLADSILEASKAVLELYQAMLPLERPA